MNQHSFYITMRHRQFCLQKNQGFHAAVLYTYTVLTTTILTFFIILNQDCWSYLKL